MATLQATTVLGSDVITDKTIQNTIASGKEMVFDGVNDYVSLGTSTQLDLGTGDGTYFVRFKNDGNDGVRNNLFSVLDGTSNDYQDLSISSAGKLVTAIVESNTVRETIGSTDIGSDSKVHSAAFYIDRSEATGMKLYLDGKEESYTQQADISTLTGSVVSSGTKYIGIYGNGSSFPFKGSIYNFRYFNCALTATEIKNLSEGGNTPYYYVGASNTEKVVNGDFAATAGWTWSAQCNITGGKLTFANGAVGYAYREDLTLIAGKKYRVKFTVSDLTEGGVNAQVRFFNTSWQVLLPTASYTNREHIVEFICPYTSASFIIYFEVSNSSFKVDNLSLISIGEILNLDPAGMSTAVVASGNASSIWNDQSGNGIDGTIVGPTLVNMPEHTNLGNLDVSGNYLSDTDSKGQLKITSPLAYNASPVAGILFATKYDAAGNYQYGASIQGYKENTTDGNFSQGLRFTTQQTSYSPLTKMTILGSGNVGIGTASPIRTLAVNGEFSLIGANAYINVSDITGSNGNSCNLWIRGLGIGGTAEVNFSKLYILADNIKAISTYSVTVGATNRDLYIDNTGLIGYVSSTIKLKDNITDIKPVNWLYKLRPINFTYKSDELKTNQYGLVAEEVELINKDFVSYDKDGEPETVLYSQLVAPLLKAVQDHQKEITELKSLNQELLKTNQELLKRIENLENYIKNK